jgi:hypothetical protein
MGQVTLSKTAEAVRARIRRLPKLMTMAIEAKAKKDAIAVITEFHDGIKESRYGLMPLASATIAAKSRAGYSDPEAPLYGKGDDAQPKSYMNMLRLRKMAKAWKVVPSKGWHWSRKIKLADMLKVHEYGCTITNGFGKGITIRIPPRPALRYAYRAVMYRRTKNDPARELREAALKLVKKGDETALRKIIKRDTLGDKDYYEAGD